MSTLVASNLQASGGGGTAATLASINGGPISGARNRIINGDMRIDQRNAGAATANTINGYTVDRFALYQTVAGKVIAQQNAGSVTPPTGFSNYLGATSQSAYAVLSSDYYILGQPIEGLNISDLGWGTVNASAVTFSFWVRSSLTGTFGGSVQNSGSTRSYPFTFTVSSASTWERKTINIPGDTSGTWLTTSGIGLALWFGLGVGSTYSGTAGSWSGSNLLSATGATSVVGTNAATFYITGVQLEAGSVATPFERRSYGQELALCQRYYELIRVGGGGYNSGNMGMRWTAPMKVLKRVSPTVTKKADVAATGVQTGTYGTYSIDDKNVGLAVTGNATAGFAEYVVDQIADAEL